MKNTFFVFFFLSVFGVSLLPVTLTAQTAFQGFDRTQYEQLLRTNKCPGCYLYHARLSNIDLTGADLRGASLVGASFRYATLRKANLRGARIGGAHFSGADLSGTIWTNGQVCAEGSVGFCKLQK